MDNMKTGMLTQEESLRFSCIRILAIISVIAAHVNTLNESGSVGMIITLIWGNIGTIGVVTFFILSGFFYQCDKGDSKAFWLKKTQSLFLPWLFCGILTFVVSVFAGDRVFSIAVFAKWLLGVKTWLWYMTILVLLYVVYKYIAKSEKALWFSVFLTTSSLTMCTFGYYLEFGMLTVYLNPFNWAGFFAIGILARKKRWDRAAMKYKIVVFPVSLVMSMMTLIGLIYLRRYGYFHLLSFVFELAMTVVFYYVASVMCRFKQEDSIFELSSCVFSIYLLHIQPAQFLAKKMPQSIVFFIFKPIICVFIIFGVFLIINRITKISGKIGGVIRCLIGIRA